ncbi:hypothetical protein P7H98_12520 [Lactococcus lactis]|uniref:hypothetical protein n=1 Tax=Lactococcus lactis TaxID=1358 RepID=UPI00288F243B|nr:hypothetical protein [Lactococcus lactis]MDT2944187.1 hypothetical protein [Lactococcus lactis]
MGKIKNLLKKFTNIGASALLLVSTLLPILALHGETTVSAANATTTLSPGGTVDTGNHTWTLGDFQTPDNFTPVGKNTSGASWTSISTYESTYDFGTNQRDTGSWLPFNGAVDMTQPLSLAGSTYASAGLFGIGSGSQLGDANGVLLTNLSSSQLSGGSTGGDLGIGNLGSGTYFIGNNYSYKKTYPFILLGSYYNTATVIAQGVGSPGSGGGKTVRKASDDYTAKNNSSNAFEMYWSNPVLNSDGTVTGKMSYSSRNANDVYTASAKLTVQKSMTIGFMAATGGNYSQMSVTIAAVDAGKGVQPVNVNYLNSATGGQLAPKGSAWKNSTITANVGDKIGVVPQGSTTNTSDAYDYFAPVAPTGYSFKTISSAVTVQNFPLGGDNPNQINVSYTPLQQSGGFTFGYDSAAQRTPTVPSKLSVTGVTDQLFSDSALNVQKDLTAKIPAGYYISKITSTGATTDATIKAFFALNTTFDTTTANNQYQVTLAPATQTGQVSFDYNNSVPTNPPALPDTIQLSGLTGSDLSFVMPTLEPGYVVNEVLGPDNKTYSSVTEALKANDHFTTGSNNFKVTIVYNGKIGFSSVPTKIDFGENTISSVEKSYQGVLDNSVVVSDTRATSLATPWTVSVAQTSPIQEVMSDTGAPVVGGISFMNYLFYDGQVLTSSPQIVYSKLAGVTGDTVVVDSKSTSLFTLKVPIDFQKADTKFKGTLSWTLTSAP